MDEHGKPQDKATEQDCNLEKAQVETPVTQRLNSTSFHGDFCVSPNDRNMPFANVSLHSDTWANTVPVSKKEKSDKLQNWRAAGRAIRRMLTKGILPTRYTDQTCADKGLKHSSSNREQFHSKCSHLNETQDGMNDMYNEFEKRSGDALDSQNVVDSQLCKLNGNNNLCETSVCNANFPNANDSGLNGTVSSVLNSLGVTESTLKPVAKVHRTGDIKQDLLRSGNVEKLQKIRSGDVHMKTVKDTCHVKTNHVKAKDSINWADLKERISRLTQKSHKKSETRTVKSVESSKERHEHQNSQELKTSTEIKLKSRPTHAKVKSRHCEDGGSQSSSEEDRKTLKSSHNNIKAKHKHGLKQRNTQVSSNVKPQESKCDRVLSTEFESPFLLKRVNSEDCFCHKNVESKVFGDIVEASSHNSMMRVSPISHCAENSSLYLGLPHTNSKTPSDRVQNNTTETANNVRKLWDDRPILTAAGLVTDSSFLDEGFEDQTTISRPLSDDLQYSGDKDLTVNIQAVHNGVHNSLSQGDSPSNYSDGSDSNFVRKSTDDFAGSSSSSNLESLSDGEIIQNIISVASENNNSRTVEQNNQAATRPKMRFRSRCWNTGTSTNGEQNGLVQRKDIASMCSATDLTSSKENLAEHCGHSNDEICECVLQFLEETRRVTSSVEEEATISDGVCTGGSMPRLISSSSEEEVAAQIILEKYRKDKENRLRKEQQDIPDLVDTEESDFCDDIPEINLPGSDGEKEQPVELSPRDIESLPDLRSSSETSSSGSEADDEFECECDMCQSNHLFSTRNNSWVTEEEEETFGTESENTLSIQYHDRPDAQQYPDPFGFNIHELNPFDLLVMRQGRRDILEVMFQNVILQMLAVYPDLLSDQAPPPLDSVDLEKIPIVSITASQIENEASCPVCLCEFEKGEEARQLGCNHIFHKLCIEAWLVKSGTCPVCRMVLSTKPAESNPP